MDVDKGEYTLSDRDIYALNCGRFELEEKLRTPGGAGRCQ